MKKVALATSLAVYSLVSMASVPMNVITGIQTINDGVKFWELHKSTYTDPYDVFSLKVKIDSQYEGHIGYAGLSHEQLYNSDMPEAKNTSLYVRTVDIDGWKDRGYQIVAFEVDEKSCKSIVNKVVRYASFDEVTLYDKDNQVIDNCLADKWYSRAKNTLVMQVSR